MSRFRSESGAFNGSVVLIVIMFIVLGVAVIDGGSILFGKLQLQDLAESAANDGAIEYRKNGNESAAYEAALTTVNARDKTVAFPPEAFEVNPNEETVKVTLTKQASVLFIDRIGPLEDLAVMKATVETPGSII